MKHEIKPVRRDRERGRDRYHNLIPNYYNYVYDAYPLNRQLVIEKTVTHQNDYSNFFIIIIIILLVWGILIYTKI